MKKSALLCLFVALATALSAQDKIKLHRNNITETFLVTESDSIYFSTDKTVAYFQIAGNLNAYPVAEIDSITFEAGFDSTIYITYYGATVEVINPLANAGVLVDVNGADVVVHATADIKDINYVISGSTDEGMLKIYSDKRFNLLLNGVSIHNSDWPALNIQSDKRARIHLVAGTNNNLSDGPDYAPAFVNNGVAEDQGACCFSEGELLFIGSGTLTVTGAGTDQHAVASDDFMEVNEGNLQVAAAVKDGVHTKEGFFMNGGALTIAASGDGIDGASGVVAINGGNILINSSADDVKGINGDSTISIHGGVVQMNIGGKQSKGIDCDQNLSIDGGAINITTTGDVLLTATGSGFDPAYTAALASNADIHIGGNATLSLIAQGKGGRGISADGDLYIDGGAINITASGAGAKYTTSTGTLDAYHAACINTDGDFWLNSGAVTLSNSGSGGKGVSTDGDFIVGNNGGNPTLNVTTTGSKITITSGSQGNYDEPKTVSCDGAITIESGQISISSNDDGIKSKESVTINGGNTVITKSVEGVEAPFITMNAGDISITASDDGFNASHGNGGEQNDGSLLSFTGGYAHVNATGGDALDSNGSIAISGGTQVIHGPQSSPEVGMDYNGTCVISGGYMVVSGTNSNMTQGASSSSTQRALTIKSSASIPANTLFHIEDANGNSLLTFAPKRSYYSIVFTSADLLAGGTYKIYTGGSCTGLQVNGLYTGGTYSGGTLRKTFTITGIVTTVTF